MAQRILICDDEGDIRLLGSEKAELLRDVFDELTASYDETQEQQAVAQFRI